MKVGVRFRVALVIVATAFGVVAFGPLREAVQDLSAEVPADALGSRSGHVRTLRGPQYSPEDISRHAEHRARIRAFHERRRARLVTLASIAGVAAALAAAMFALRGPIARLRQLTGDVRASSQGGYKLRTEVGGADEIGDLARAFNEAATSVREHINKLETRDRALTDYVHGMTHDLAIPLTVLQGRLTQLDADTKASRVPDAETVQAAFAECQYLAQLVANLGAAARLQTGDSQLSLREVDLRALVERVVLRHRPVADHRGVTLDFAVPDEAVVAEGDDLLLERAVSNLVHNAIRHLDRPRGEGHVAVVLDKTSAGFSLLVKDDGRQATPALASALERGEALPPSSSRGTGLGMRIVRDVARLHGFALHFTAPEEGGLEVRLKKSLAT